MSDTKNSITTNFHLFLYKRQQPNKSFFFKTYSDEEQVLLDNFQEVSLDSDSLTLPEDQIYNFSKKYKFLLTYWSYLKNDITSKKLPQKITTMDGNYYIDSLIFSNLDDLEDDDDDSVFIFKMYIRVFFVNSTNFTLFDNNLLNKANLLSRWSYISDFDDLLMDIFETEVVQLEDAIETFIGDFFVSFFNFDDGSVVFFDPYLWFFLSYENFVVTSFDGQYINEDSSEEELSDDEDDEQEDEEEAEEADFDASFLSLVDSKFIGRQKNLFENILSKYDHSTWSRYLDTFFNKINHTISYKYLVLLVLLSTNVEDDDMLDSIRSLYRKKIFSSAHFNKNYLNLYKYWPNTTPFFYFDDSVYKQIVKVQEEENVSDLAVYLRQYLGGFVENLTGRKTFIKIQTQMPVSLEAKKYLFEIYRINWIWQKLIGAGFFFFDMLSVMWFSFFTKDLQFLMSWFGRSMSRLSIGKHRRFIKLFKSLLYRYSNFFLDSNNILGFRFDIRGKVGVTGNAKKRHTHFNIGKSSFSRKNLRIEYQQGLVYTDTGVMGVTMVISF